jgi:hypothetical protein
MHSFILAQLIAAMTLGARAAPVSAATPQASFAGPAISGAANDHKIYGFVVSLRGNTLVIANRAGKNIVVDGSFAHSTVHFYRGRAVIVFGTVDAAGTVHANAVWRTFPDAAHWPADQ